MTDPIYEGLPPLASQSKPPPPEDIPDAEVEAKAKALRDQVRAQNRQWLGAAQPPIAPAKAVGGGGAKFDPRTWLAVLTAKAGDAAKTGGSKKYLLGGIGLAALVAIVIGTLMYFGVLGGSTPPVYHAPAPVGNVSPTVPTTPPRRAYNGWDFSFKVPTNRIEWGLGWELAWLVLILVNFFFRSEARHRGEIWDWLNTSLMLLTALLVMVMAKGLVVVAVDQCNYWFVGDCPIGTLSVDLIDNGALVVWLLTGLVVFFGSAVAAFTGRVDFTPWAVGTFSVGMLAKLLLPLGAAQTFAVGVVGLGLVIYLLEIGGLAKGKLTAGGLFAVGLGLIIMAIASYVLALAFGYLANGAAAYPLVALWLYQGRFLWGLLTGWLVATAITYAVTPAIAPQIERLGTGSVVVGDSEKIDTVIFLLMVAGMLFAFNWAMVLAALT